jgi:hypothetical protein
MSIDRCHLCGRQVDTDIVDDCYCDADGTSVYDVADPDRPIYYWCSACLNKTLDEQFAHECNLRLLPQERAE